MSGVRNYLHRYWIRWDEEASRDARTGSGLGCGVTAFDVDDAKRLVELVALQGDPLPAIAEILEDVDVRTLDAGHVLPNMGDPSVRGVWFPHY